MTTAFFTALAPALSWNPASAGFLANHLWQSTIFAAIVALLAVALRHNRAQVRHWLWLAASVKFLFPFAALVALGNRLSWSSAAPTAASEMMVVLDAVIQPFSPPAVSAIAAAPPVVESSDRFAALPVLVYALWAAGCALMLLIWWGRWRRVAAAVRDAAVVDCGREWEILRRLDHGGLPLVSSDSPLEPGVFGILRPVLLWPRSISDRLSDAQIEAVLAHELAHLRRRDNLTAALHMVAQSLFWFHPLVWWVGARLVDERERACDEEVIRRGSEPHVYAETILKICRAYVAFRPPLVCVSGMTGSDLKKRIEQIMRPDAGFALTVWRKMLIIAAGLAAITGPIAAGVVQAPRLGAQTPAVAAGDTPTFEVASIKRNKSGANGPSGTRALPSGQFVATNVMLRQLIANAYGMPLQPLLPSQIIGAPDWVTSEHFDILAKAEGSLPTGPASPLPLMIRALLAERFKLEVHTEQRDLPIYALVPARSDRRAGPQLAPSEIDCAAPRGRGTPPPPPPGPLPGERPRCGIRFLIGNLSAGGVTMAQLANALSRLVGRVVVDKTALGGGFDLDLQWTPERMPQAPSAAIPFQPPVDPNGPSIYTALQEQLGLKLDAQTGPVDVLVIDSVDRLTDDDEFDAPPAIPPPPPPAPRPQP